MSAVRQAAAHPRVVAALAASVPVTLWTALYASLADPAAATSLVSFSAFALVTVVAGASAFRLAVSRRDARARLRRSRRRLRKEAMRTRALTERMLDALIVVGPDTRIESVNPAACAMFGYAEHELVGAHLGLLVPERLGDTRAFLRDATPRAVGVVSEWEGRRKGGTVFPFQLSMFTYEDAAGVHYAGLLRDLSDRDRAEIARREFVATVSHELRTPLTSIRGSLSLLASGILGDLPGDAMEAVAIANRNAGHLNALIDDVLHLERLGSGSVELQIEPVVASQLAARAIEVAGGMAAQLGVHVRVSRLDGAAALRGDSDRLVQVLVNLLSNAVKFSPSGGQVTLSALRTERDVEFRVDDEGRGVPEEMRSAIFERFRQVDRGDACQKGGTGLGLAICKAIVEQHGGCIGVSDGPEGRGSRFWFRLPLDVPEALHVAA